jgi:pSer/pThr/pTyr-binding forkhead associated (FHA) protein
VPIANIGRADYNDVVLADPSVSTTHAKLQRRDNVWVLSDAGSTNGTYVEGERVAGEVPLSAGTTIRFGEVAVLWEPFDQPSSSRASGTRVVEVHDLATAPGAGAGPAPKPGGLPAWLLGVLGLVILALGFFLLR